MAERQFGKRPWLVGAVLAVGSLTVAACWDPATLDVSSARLDANDAADGADAGDSGAEADADSLPEAAADVGPGPGCPPPLVACGAFCTDTRADPLNCGACGVSCAQPPPSSCNGPFATSFSPGQCVASSCSYPSQTVDCGAQGRDCVSGACGACSPGLQDNDLDGTCLPACGPLTCNSNGVCTDLVGPATCTCGPGFTGPTCAENIDDCAANPCQNGGACVDGVDSYTCLCANGYSGPNCEVLVPTFLWVDATDAMTITKDGTDHVTEWRDKSGLGRHATVPGGSSPPLWADNLVNGMPAIVFDGDTVRLQTAPVTTSSEMTIFVVFNMLNPQTWGSLINQSHDTYFSIRKSDCCGGGGNLNFHIENNNAAPLQPIFLNTWKVVTALREGDVSTFYYDQGTATTFTGDTLTAGASVPITLGNAMAIAESMGGFIAEVQAFSSALPQGTRATIETQLKTKYAIP